MDVSLEPSLSNIAEATEQPGQLAGRPLDEWNAAYGRVELYFHALRVRNKILLNRLVILVLKRAMRRAPQETNRSASELAAEEMDHVVTDWFAEVLQQPAIGTDQMLSTRGRLALLLADMPGKWQDQFLRPGPWPPEFVEAMRRTYQYSGPDFQLSKMTARPFDLGPITTLTNFTQLPYGKMLVTWLVFCIILVLIFVLTH
jgi:hypothetical protein